MNDLTVIILTYEESIHIKRCLDSLGVLADRVVVVDSFSTDNTCEIAVDCGVEVFQNPFVTQAAQFQWAMDNCRIDTSWVMRLDADETIDDELISSIEAFISNDGHGHNAAIFNRKHIFLGKWIRYGGRYPLPMLRLFRQGTAHVEPRWMDEHIVLNYGSSMELVGGFCDDNLNSVSWFVDKHNKYATREMIDIKLKQLLPQLDSKITDGTSFKIKFKRFFKQSVYMKLPYFFRPFIYFCFRYFIQLGFLDGSRGFAYHYMQGFWYRCLVDLKCLEADREWQSCKTKLEKIAVLEALSGYTLQEAKDEVYSQ